MKTISKFRDGELSRKLIDKICVVSDPSKKYNIMEVCGTHTMAISKLGIRNVLPQNIRLVSGPGCPVCVTPQGEIDAIFTLLEENDITLCVYGDMMKVPGTSGKNLLDYKSEGYDVRVVLSCLDVFKFAEKSTKDVVFVSIGFETTNPTVAALIKILVENHVKNTSIMLFNKTMPEVLGVLLNDKLLNIDGFLCPGHVSVMTGASLYEPVVRMKKAAVITGFEPVDILSSIYEIVRQVNENNYKIVNNYPRTVKYEGNSKASGLVCKYLKKTDSSWRGIGVIERSGLSIKEEFSFLDAVKKYRLEVDSLDEIDGCSCGEVLKGRKFPHQCALFGNVCNTENPVGPCMVSSEGACAAYYKYDYSGVV